MYPKVLLENGWNSKRMITEGDAAIPLETTRRAFCNHENSKQRSAIKARHTFRFNPLLISLHFSILATFADKRAQERKNIKSIFYKKRATNFVRLFVIWKIRSQFSFILEYSSVILLTLMSTDEKGGSFLEAKTFVIRLKRSKNIQKMAIFCNNKLFAQKKNSVVLKPKLLSK